MSGVIRSPSSGLGGDGAVNDRTTTVELVPGTHHQVNGSSGNGRTSVAVNGNGHLDYKAADPQ